MGVIVILDEVMRFLDFMGKLGYNTYLGDALHRRECTLKNSKPTMIKSRKIGSKYKCF